jgi:hypothetical protein
MSHDAEYEEYERQESMQFRRSMGFPPIGPLTLEQSVTARKYEKSATTRNSDGQAHHHP